MSAAGLLSGSKQLDLGLVHAAPFSSVSTDAVHKLLTAQLRTKSAETKERERSGNDVICAS